MIEEEKRRWDARLAIFGPLLTVATIVAGIWQFNRDASNRALEQTRSAQLQDNLEFRRQLWKDEKQSCEQVTTLAAQIVAEADVGARPDALIKDWIAHYWSVSLTLNPSRALDKAVEGALIEFRVDLQDFRDGESDAEMTNRLKIHSHALGEACSKKIRAGSSEILQLGQSPPE